MSGLRLSRLRQLYVNLDKAKQTYLATEYFRLETASIRL